MLMAAPFAAPTKFSMLSAALPMPGRRRESGQQPGSCRYNHIPPALPAAPGQRRPHLQPGGSSPCHTARGWVQAAPCPAATEPHRHLCPRAGLKHSAYSRSTPKNGHACSQSLLQHSVGTSPGHSHAHLQPEAACRDGYRQGTALQTPGLCLLLHAPSPEHPKAAARHPPVTVQACPAPWSCATGVGQTHHGDTHPDRAHPMGSLHAHAAAPTPHSSSRLHGPTASATGLSHRPRGCHAARPGLPCLWGQQQELPWFIPAAVSQAEAARLWEAAG